MTVERGIRRALIVLSVLILTVGTWWLAFDDLPWFGSEDQHRAMLAPYPVFTVLDGAGEIVLAEVEMPSSSTFHEWVDELEARLNNQGHGEALLDSAGKSWHLSVCSGHRSVICYQYRFGYHYTELWRPCVLATLYVGGLWLAFYVFRWIALGFVGPHAA
jgi:hypothetical protein